MRVGNFSVLVLPGRERDSGHVVLPHGSVYSLRLGNNFSGRRCDAEVTIDGKPVGTFRLASGEAMTLERPAHDEGRFTFYRADSAEAATAGGGKISGDARGLVQVVFRPEMRNLSQYVTRGGTAETSLDCYKGGEEKTSGGIIRSMGMGQAQNCSAGITGLSEHSNQRFQEVACLNYDVANETTITLRLVAGDEGPRELTAAQVRSNPVPAPVSGS